MVDRMNSTPSLTLQQNLAIRLLRVLRYNKARSERAVILMEPNQRPLFQVIPFLLHINHPEFPGYIDNIATPHGLDKYSLRPKLAAALNATFPTKLALLQDIKQVWPQQKQIDALVLMGSIGSIAQAKDSDFDYWVCIDGNKISSKAIALLQQKLNKIEHWAKQSHQLEVHFFISEIDKVRNNDFGEADGESSGSAQAIFLKAEFYTTHLVVAGKAPFWWLTPEQTTEQQYQEALQALKNMQNPDPSLFMDLGNLERMDPQELFGAAIWQISKAMDSPFKAVLKMAKLEVFVESIGRQQPLCNLLKKRVHNGAHAPGDLEQVDPYALMFDELIDFYTRIGKTEVVQLLQLCLYIKCDCALSQAPTAEELNFKQQIVSSYVTQWGWSKEKIRKVDGIKYWHFSELSLLSRQIYSFLLNCYRRMSAKLSKQKQSVNQQDMTVIGRKIEAFYASKENKIHYLRSVFDNELYCRMVSIKAETNKVGRRWSMYRGHQPIDDKQALQKVHLRSSNNPLDLLAWGVANRIIDSHTRILLGYNTDPLVDEDLQRLTQQIETIFPAVKVSELSRQALLQPLRVLNCLVIVNLETKRQKASMHDLSVLYSTSWGEMFHLRGLKGLAQIRAELLVESAKPNLYVHIPDTPYKPRILQDLCSKADIQFDFIL